MAAQRVFIALCKQLRNFDRARERRASNFINNAKLQRFRCGHDLAAQREQPRTLPSQEPP
jgi:hypothetical protein